jgi:hypothetical protein
MDHQEGLAKVSAQGRVGIKASNARTPPCVSAGLRFATISNRRVGWSRCSAADALGRAFHHGVQKADGAFEARAAKNAQQCAPKRFSDRGTEECPEGSCDHAPGDYRLRSSENYSALSGQPAGEFRQDGQVNVQAHALDAPHPQRAIAHSFLSLPNSRSTAPRER